MSSSGTNEFLHSSSEDFLAAYLPDMAGSTEKSEDWNEEEIDYASMTNSSDSISSFVNSSSSPDQEEIPWDESIANLSDLSLSSFMSVPLGKTSSIREKFTREERLQMYELRHHLNLLDMNLEKTEKDVADKREALKKCENKIADLQVEEENVCKELEEAEKSNNVTVVNRLKAHHKRITKDLEHELKQKDEVREMLSKAEYSYISADLEKGKFQVAEESLEKKEKQLSQELAELSRLRRYKEELKAWRAKKSEETKINQHIEQSKKKELQKKIKSAERQRVKSKIAPFLKATFETMEGRKNEEMMQADEMAQRMKKILALKEVMETKKESMKKKIANEKMRKAIEEEEELEEKEKISEAGGNAELVILLKQKKKKNLHRQLMFQHKQEENYQKIVQKLLCEEKVKKKEERRQRALMKKEKDFIKRQADVSKPHRLRKKFEYLLHKNFPENKDMKEKEDSQDEERNPLFRQSSIVDLDDVESENDLAIPKVSTEKLDDDDDADDNMAAPEFEGLWNRQESTSKLKTETNAAREGKRQSKMEKEIMERQMEKLRNPVVKNPMLAGRELKGCGFIGKPDVIKFKNIDVGKTYKQKIVITNVSYTVNYIKLIGVSTSLQDFVQIEFLPPGQISAGMTCDLFVTFTPKLNEDLSGEVNFLSKTGKFSIPLKCSTKKCELSVDLTVVNFGTAVIEDVLKKTIILTNSGALGTEFEFANPKAPSKNQVIMENYSKEENIVFSEESELSHISDSKDLQSPSKENVENIQSSSSLEMDKSRAAVEKKICSDDSEVHHSSSVLAVLCDMCVGEEHAGYIAAHSTVKLEIVWRPKIPGPTETDFLLTFSDTLSQPITVKAIGHATDVPVYLKEPSLNMKICMYDRLYQETILLFNRETSALMIRFEVPKQMQNHLEVLPKIGYIQAKSQFQAQLKFLPRKSIAEDAPKYFDPKTCVLEIPIIIWIAKHAKAVEFFLHAVVTSSDLQFSVKTIDFGYCTVHESVRSCIQLINNSLLPQEFGFVELPSCVSVQPDDGFGTILPLETINLDVLFRPCAAKEYNFQLVCKSLINRDFCLHGKGIGVWPPLELSHQKIIFKETALYDESEAIIFVASSLTQEQKEMNALFKRTGKGDGASLGPMSFEFVVPQGVPIKISPIVGTVEPDQKVKVQVRFCPVLEEEEIKTEGVKIATQIYQMETENKSQAALHKEDKENEEFAMTKGSKKPSKTSKVSKVKAEVSSFTAASDLETSNSVSPPSPDSITKDSRIYSSVVTYLLQNYLENKKKYRIPCYIAAGKCLSTRTLPYKIQNTLFLEVHCTTIRPPIIILSDFGSNHIDFGDVCVGHSTKRILIMQNISDQTLDLTSSVLDTMGPFSVKNAIRSLNPAETLTLIMQFAPLTGEKFFEVLEFKSATTKIFLRLKGTGIIPKVQFPFENELLDMGCILAGDFCQKSFKLENESALDIDYSIKLDSKSEMTSNPFQFPYSISRELSGKKEAGTSNYNGFDVFDFVPVEGKIPAGGSKEILVTFAPDHESDNYSDIVSIEFFREDIVHSFKVIGQGTQKCVLVEGYDEIVCNTESLAFSPVIQCHEDDSKPPPVILAISLESFMIHGKFTTAKREIYLRSITPSAASTLKKGGEFIFECPHLAVSKGFTVEPLKGSVDIGAKELVTISWTPPQGFPAGESLEMKLALTMKCGDGTVQRYEILLQGLVFQTFAD